MKLDRLLVSIKRSVYFLTKYVLVRNYFVIELSSQHHRFLSFYCDKLTKILIMARTMEIEPIKSTTKPQAHN